MLKPSGHRLEEKHNLIIKKWAKKWKTKDGPTLRKILEYFDEKFTYESKYESF